jgi:hypothetical protein
VRVAGIAHSSADRLSRLGEVATPVTLRDYRVDQPLAAAVGEVGVIEAE